MAKIGNKRITAAIRVGIDALVFAVLAVLLNIAFQAYFTLPILAGVFLFLLLDIIYLITLKGVHFRPQCLLSLGFVYCIHFILAFPNYLATIKSGFSMLLLILFASEIVIFFGICVIAVVFLRKK
ncbi:MAG: hypothetical protein Ta2A_03390 [Treponemataceae bacterium]|nr:MAG: hypothetical protein Ta2A_03390 [Treponemataceae bacterium]